MNPIHSKTMFLLNYKKKFGTLPKKIYNQRHTIADLETAKKKLAELIDNILFIDVSDDYMKYIGNEIRILEFACEQDHKEDYEHFHYDWVDHWENIEIPKNKSNLL